MKKQLLSLAAIFIIAIFSNNVMAQETATATATATIVTPITIDWSAHMNFGILAVQDISLGTLVLTPAGVRNVTGGVSLSTANVGTVSPAIFNVAGEGAYTFAITLPGSYTITNSTSDTMTVDTFTSNGVTNLTGQLSSGSFELKVGATLNVAAAQPAGVYTNGTGFSVTVNYN